MLTIIHRRENMITTGLSKSKEHALQVVEEVAHTMSELYEVQLGKAIANVATRNGVERSTIVSQCTRELGGFGLDVFSAGVKNEICGGVSDHVKNKLIDGEPEDVQLEILHRLEKAKVNSKLDLV